MQLGLQRGVIFPTHPYGLGLNETLLPQYLKNYGYSTHMIGKVYATESLVYATALTKSV